MNRIKAFLASTPARLIGGLALAAALVVGTVQFTAAPAQAASGSPTQNCLTNYTPSVCQYRAPSTFQTSSITASGPQVASSTVAANTVQHCLTDLGISTAIVSTLGAGTTTTVTVYDGTSSGTAMWTTAIGVSTNVASSSLLGVTSVLNKSFDAPLCTTAGNALTIAAAQAMGTSVQISLSGAGYDH